MINFLLNLPLPVWIPFYSFFGLLTYLAIKSFRSSFVFLSQPNIWWFNIVSLITALFVFGIKEGTMSTDINNESSTPTDFNKN